MFLWILPEKHGQNAPLLYDAPPRNDGADVNGIACKIYL